MSVTLQQSLDQLVLHSTGQRNSFIEYVCWTSKVKRLARTLVQSKSDPIQVRLREGGEIRALRVVCARWVICAEFAWMWPH